MWERVCGWDWVIGDVGVEVGMWERDGVELGVMGRELVCVMS